MSVKSYETHIHALEARVEGLLSGKTAAEEALTRAESVIEMQSARITELEGQLVTALEEATVVPRLRKLIQV